MIDEEFRTALHDRLGPALDELVPPDLLAGVRARQVRHKHSVRAGLALASVASVAALVVAVLVWPHVGSALPSGPTRPADPASEVPVTSGPAAAMPSPSTAVVNMAGVAPLVTSGPCAGLAVAAYQESAGVHPPVTALTSDGIVLTMTGGQILDLKTNGRCTERLSYVQRTPGFQDDLDVPYSFPDNRGGVVSQSAPRNQTGVIQLFLDCEGLDCSGSGAPLTTVTVHVPGTAPGAAAGAYPVVPSEIPLPTGETITIPSVLGMSPDAAQRALLGAGLGGVGSNAMNNTGTVTWQDPPAGSVVLKGSTDDFYVTGAQI